MSDSISARTLQLIDHSLGLTEKGGPGSGHWGHRGRKGKRGGSARSGAGAPAPRSTLSQKDYVTSLPNAQEEAVRDYVEGDYKPINAYLRAGTESDEMDVRAAVKGIDVAMASAPPLTTATLYRGLAKPPAEMGMKVGEVWRDDGFTSTTKSSRYMYEELSGLKTRARIKLPKKIRSDIRGLEIFRMGLRKQRKNEQEILLARGTSFKVVSIEKSGKYTDVVLEVVE